MVGCCGFPRRKEAEVHILRGVDMQYLVSCLDTSKLRLLEGMVSRLDSTKLRIQEVDLTCSNVSSLHVYTITILHDYRNLYMNAICFLRILHARFTPIEGSFARRASVHHTNVLRTFHVTRFLFMFDVG